MVATVEDGSAAHGGRQAARAPLAPRSRVEPRSEPRDLGRGYERGGRDARAAVGHEVASLAGIEQPAERRRREEAAARGHGGEGDVLRARDVPRHRVDRLELAAEAGGRAGIDHGELLVDEPGDQLVRPRGVVLALARLERLPAHPRPRRDVVERAARLTPAAQPAVEHRGALVAEMAQEPPEPRGASLAGLVVGDHHALGPDARVGDRPREVVGVGERVPALAGPRRPREVLLHVEEVRGRDVPLLPGAPPGPGRSERPTAVDDDEVAMADAVEQPFGCDERSEGHGTANVTLTGMRAMVLDAPKTALREAELPDPEPVAGQVLLEVHACGVCRTDPHIVDGELTEPKLPLVIGHQIVGHVLGDGGERFDPGARVGVPWLGWTDGTCRYCRSGRENLCDEARFTGYDIDGGYAELTVADERFCFPIPDGYHDLQAAPLLCAGLIGDRALRMTGDAERLGIYGFGSAAHIVTQTALNEGRPVFAFTRAADEDTQAFARERGAEWPRASMKPGPDERDAAIIFAPAGPRLPAALAATAKGGIVVCAGIHMSDI